MDLSGVFGVLAFAFRLRVHNRYRLMCQLSQVGCVDAPSVGQGYNSVARGELVNINKGSNVMAIKAERISKYQIICFDSSVKVDNRKTTI